MTTKIASNPQDRLASTISITPQTSNTPVNLNGVAFPDTCHGWAEGAIDKADGTRVGAIVATSDGGATWREVHKTTMTLRDIAFPDILHGWAVGDNGTILTTADGGGHWTSKPSLTDARLFRVAFPDIKHGWAVGVTTTGGGVTLATADGGDTWTPQADPGQMLFGVGFP
jgi:photosystem II stability/assembly factor-like uncharacterized protein